MIKQLENGFEVLNAKGKMLRSYKIVGLDIIYSNVKQSWKIHSSSTEAMIKDHLAYDLSKEQAKLK